MQSKVDIRKYAVEIAVRVMGTGTPDKDVISKAKEIEEYIIGDAVIPDTYDETNAIGGLIGNVLSNTMETKPKK